MASAEVARLPTSSSGTKVLRPSTDPDEINEELMTEQVKVFTAKKNAKGFEQLIQELRQKLPHPKNAGVSKAKAAKWVRTLVDLFLDSGTATPEAQIRICRDCIEWAREEKRTFLRQSLECRLVAVHYDNKNYQEALKLGGVLLKELKKVDDKNLLVEVQLLESKTYHALSNLPRARAALTSARTTANSIYCPPNMQADLDLQSGILHAADEKDFKTAYSYFYEAFEGLDSIESPRALTALKYMLLSKIMLNTPEEVTQLLGGKLALKYVGPDLDAMRDVAKAAHKRSLADFDAAQRTYNKELAGDTVINAHLQTLYDKMMEQNLSRIIEPYSKVEVSHVAKTIGLPIRNVEDKLSQMILDKKLSGVLDQGAGLLVIFESNEENIAYEAALGLIQNMGKVVDALYHKAKRLT